MIDWAFRVAIVVIATWCLFVAVGLPTIMSQTMVVGIAIAVLFDVVRTTIVELRNG